MVELRRQGLPQRGGMPGRLVAVLLLVALAAGMLGVRLAAAPSAGRIRIAMAAGPGGRLFVAEPRQGLLALNALGHRLRLGPLPTASPLSLAASGARLLLGAYDDIAERAVASVMAAYGAPVGHAERMLSLIPL